MSPKVPWLRACPPGVFAVPTVPVMDGALRFAPRSSWGCSAQWSKGPRGTRAGRNLASNSIPHSGGERSLACLPLVRVSQLGRLLCRLA